ncbi:MAG: hypothetical protein RR869_08895 [Lachnospiraceae bacterium]
MEENLKTEDEIQGKIERVKHLEQLRMQLLECEKKEKKSASAKNIAILALIVFCCLGALQGIYLQMQYSQLKQNVEKMSYQMQELEDSKKQTILNDNKK